MTSINLADRAWEGELTVEEVNAATKERLERKSSSGNTVLYWASNKCGIKVVEAIINKGVDVNGFSTSVSIVFISIYIGYYYTNTL
jgi:hypothetical protein